MNKSRKKVRGRSPATNAYDADESDSEELPSGYQKVPIQVATIDSSQAKLDSIN